MLECLGKSLRVSTAAAVSVLALISSTHAQTPPGGWTESDIVDFAGRTNGAWPFGGLAIDNAGGLYGETAGGGSSFSGTLFELIPITGGGLKYKLLYSFPSSGPMGYSPQGDVTLYSPSGGAHSPSGFHVIGTTYWGGSSICFGGAGCGAVYKLDRSTGPMATWSLTTLHMFTGGSDGAQPSAGPAYDAAGNIYGTASGGGGSGNGVVFELSPPPAGQSSPWTFSVIHDFGGYPNDGSGPAARLVFDAQGNLYGTTIGGGPSNGGTVFMLTPPAAGQTTWTETVLQNFPGRVGVTAPVILDAAGNLYGTTYAGGQYGAGMVFMLTKPAPGQPTWTLSTLYSFQNTFGGAWGGLTFDKAGNLYGATLGAGPNYGRVFKLSPPAAGQSNWTETTLHQFSGNNGHVIYGGVTFDKAGNLYGTTGDYGYGDFGSVFKLTP